MVGKQIHLLYRQDFKRGELVLLCPHATYDGALEQMKRENKQYEATGFHVEECANGFMVYDRFGVAILYYYISTRTIEK